MTIRQTSHPRAVMLMPTDELRQEFLIESLFIPDAIQLTYTHYDRMIVGGIMPVRDMLALAALSELRSEFFLERREAGFINVGGPGQIHAGDISYDLDKLDCLYVGKGVQNVRFSSQDATNPACFYLLSCPAHQTHPTRRMTSAAAAPVDLGTPETANQRTIFKYIHLDGLQSCQLVMGLTTLRSGSVWNTMPAHTHDRRMEVYLYFDLPADQRVFHFMGEPTQTRHLVVGNEQAVISPPWSIHSGCGTTNYSFVWGMAGENMLFTDMDAVAIADLR